MDSRSDPWAPFRIWLALTIGLYALRASFVTGWLGAIPGFLLLLMVLGVLLLAARALLFPGRVVPWLAEEQGWWSWFLRRPAGRRGNGRR